MTKEQKQVVSTQIIMLTKDDVKEITGWRTKYSRPYILLCKDFPSILKGKQWLIEASALKT